MLLPARVDPRGTPSPKVRVAKESLMSTNAGIEHNDRALLLVVLVSLLIVVAGFVYWAGISAREARTLEPDAFAVPATAASADEAGAS